MMGGFIVQTIKVLNFRGFAGKIDRLGGVSLHAKCKFIGCNTGCKGGIVLGLEHPADLQVIQQKYYSSGAETGALLKLIESLFNLTPFQRSEIEMIIRGGSK
jgi:hypothetical protein